MPPPAATQAAPWLWTARVARSSLSSLFLMTSPASIMRASNAAVKTRFTRGRVRELKNAHNSVTVQNRTHVYMKLFDHKNLGNHLLQLRPKVVKHPVYIVELARRCISSVSWCACSLNGLLSLYNQKKTVRIEAHYECLWLQGTASVVCGGS